MHKHMAMHHYVNFFNLVFCLIFIFLYEFMDCSSEQFIFRQFLWRASFFLLIVTFVTASFNFIKKAFMVMTKKVRLIEGYPGLITDLASGEACILLALFNIKFGFKCFVI